MNYNEANHYKHRKYRLINTYDTSSDVLDIKTNITHRCFKLNTHKIGDEFYLYESGRGDYDVSKIFFQYSIINLYKAGETYTFDIIEERDNLMFLSNHKHVRLAAPISFKESSDQIKIDLEVEELELDSNRIRFKKTAHSKEKYEEIDYSIFEEKVNYEFKIERTFFNRRGNLNMVVSYDDKNYYINVPSHLSKVDFKSPVLAHIASSKDGTEKYIRLSRKYISESLYDIEKSYTFTIENQIQDFENGLSYWTVKDSIGNRVRYYPEGDLTFGSELAKLEEGDKVDLIVKSITEKGHVKLISQIKDWDEKNYLVEEVFEAIGFIDQEDQFFFNYVNILGDEDDDEEVESLENSYLEQYNEGNNLWVFSYLGFLDTEIYDELDKGGYETAKTLIKIYLGFEKWILEDSDYLTNFSDYKIADIIQKAESKIIKLKATLKAINIFLEGEDGEFIENLNASLARTPYLSQDRREVLMQFLSISQYFIGDSDFKKLSETIFLLIERNLISSEDRWVYINSIGSFIYRIKQRVTELVSEEMEQENSKELKLLIQFNYLLVYLNVLDNNLINATRTSVGLLRNLSLYYDKVEYLDLAIKLLLHNGYVEPNIFRHKNIFELDSTQLKDISVFNNDEEQSYIRAGNISSVNGEYVIIPRNLYSGQGSCHLKSLARLGEFNLYVKSHYNLKSIDVKENLDVVLKNAIQAIKHSSINSNSTLNLQSYRDLDISYEKTYSGIVKKIPSNKLHCYLTCIIDDVEIDTLLHVNSFHKNRIVGRIEDYIQVGDKVKFKVTKIEDDKIAISPSFLVNGHAELVLEEGKSHFGKIINKSKNASRILTDEGLSVTIYDTAYDVGQVLKLKLQDYRESSHTFVSHEYEVCNKTISRDKSEIFREYLISIGMIVPRANQTTLENDLQSNSNISKRVNNKDLRNRSITLIHTLEQRLKYITDPKEIALNYFFIISIAGVLKNPKSFEYSNKLNNLAEIIAFEYSNDIELLDSNLQVEFLSKQNLEKLEEENSTIALLKYMNTEFIDLPVNVNPTSPQYKLKKLIESVNLLKTYELDGKLTEVLKKIVVHELYSATLQVNHGSFKELDSFLTEDLGIEQEEKKKRIVTNLGAESKYKEFKSSLFYSASEVPQIDVILRTICGFLNAYDGIGSLFIGVDDSGEIIGLKDDLSYNDNINTLDKYLNHLQSKVATAFPKEINALLDYKFSKSKNLNYLEIIIPSHNKPISYKNEFYQRQGVQTRILKGEDITDFILRKSNNISSVQKSLVAQDDVLPVLEKRERSESREVSVNKSTMKFGKQEVIDFYEDLKQEGEFQFTDYNVSNDNLLGYLYIYHDNTYSISATKKEQYKFEVPITEKYRFGHLLFCYDNACVNKVDVRSVINKSFNVIYMNAVSNHGKLIRIIKSLPKEQIAIETKRFNKNYVKLYDIDKISEHRIMGLKGNCIVQEDFDEVVGYYHNESLPDRIDVFKRESRQGFGGEVSKYTEEYELLLESSN